MTRVDFHTNVADKLGFACRLARKAYMAGQPVVVLAEPDVLKALDERLWTFAPLEFVPHCLADSALAAQTPVVLTSTLDAKLPHHQVLMNLGLSLPANFASFERLLEIVANDANELQAGRERYRFYRDRGYPLANHKQDA